MNESPPTLDGNIAEQRRVRDGLPFSPWLLWGIVFLISAGLVVYSQTLAFVWDEGFHLVAAQLILAGKRPYLDFCFPQTPLNAYWNAAWMHLFGQSWRVTHYVAALEVAGAVLLTAQFVASRFPAPRWRNTGAISAAILLGLNIVVVQFGTVAQAYGIGLLLSVVAFRVAIVAMRSSRLAVPFGAGLAAGAAAGCTLLTAPVAPVVFVWLLIHSRSNRRLTTSLAFVCGVLLPFAPVCWLFAQGPRQVFFNIVQYQALYRHTNWPGATLHDLAVFSGWLDSTQGLLLGLLAAAGALFIARKREWPEEHRAEFSLAGWIAAALLLYISTAHPTFERYYIPAVPFVSVLAVAGLYRIGPRLSGRSDPSWPALLVCVLIALALGKDLFDDADSARWSDYDSIAAKVQQVTPRSATLYAEEPVYFLLRWTPPPGMEFSYSHKLELPPAQEALFHIISENELQQQIAAGRFDTVETCKDELIDKYKLTEVFRQEADAGDCSVFWGKKK